MTERMAGMEPLIVLCERLVGATAARRVRWELEGDDVFVWNADDGAVAITSRDRDGDPPYALAIYNSDRAKVEELSSDLVEGDAPAPWNEPLANLYRIARRSGLRADDIIDALIAALPPAERSADNAPEALATEA